MIPELMNAYTFGDLQERIRDIEERRGYGCSGDDVLYCICMAEWIFMSPNAGPLLNRPAKEAVEIALNHLAPFLNRTFGPSRVEFDPVLSHPTAHYVALSAMVDRLNDAYDQARGITI